MLDVAIWHCRISGPKLVFLGESEANGPFIALTPLTIIIHTSVRIYKNLTDR